MFIVAYRILLSFFLGSPRPLLSFLGDGDMTESKLIHQIICILGLSLVLSCNIQNNLEESGTSVQSSNAEMAEILSDEGGVTTAKMSTGGQT